MNDTPVTALKVHLKHKDALYKSYMAFLAEGGLFIPTAKKFVLADKIHLELRLLDDLQMYSINTCVAWISPASAQGRWMTGVGVQFSGEQGRQARHKIEVLLADALSSDKMTNTM